MKRLAIVLIALIAINTQAQEDSMRQKRDLNPEQMATLLTKKMTLHLDLNESQQREVKSLNLKMAKERKAKKSNRGKELTQDQRFTLRNDMLDRQIALKGEMKKILNEEQFAKWEKSRRHKARGFKKKREETKGKRKRRHEKRD